MREMSLLVVEMGGSGLLVEVFVGVEALAFKATTALRMLARALLDFTYTFSRASFNTYQNN